ncbi:hypothetical protein AB8A31_07600 [Tardiphaga sp. 804_B3_N1_9]|uniref:hypothetical protein n=1 Tax=Tardiphaga TaxID=1395974 RepID=UPI0015861E29|nr:hypothetical protein [Tardiphaga robiniae]
MRADIEDIFYLYDARLDGNVDIKKLCAVFELPWRRIYYLPKARSSSVSGFHALAAADVAELLIQLERLGFALDPMPLVEALMPSIKSLRRITEAQLSILWFAKNRHKMAPQALEVEGRATFATKIERLRMSSGYKAELWWGDAGEPLLLSVDAPRFRRRASPKETVCAQCGYTWFKGDPDASANHRREHKLRMRVLNPEPLSQLAQARLTDSEPELVTATSPAWKHREIYERARFFRREFGYDFVQWDSSDGDSDPNVHGFLFLNERDLIVGACAFRLRDQTSGKNWGLQWVWVCPMFRRTGVLARYWGYFRKRFGDFDVEGPVSPAMQAFAVKQGDTVLLGYNPSL